jgi:hypothetical protein
MATAIDISADLAGRVALVTGVTLDISGGRIIT